MTDTKAYVEKIVEEVAIGICENRPERFGFWDTVPDCRRKAYRTYARAALKVALKMLAEEPCEEMVNMGYASNMRGPEAVFKAMLSVPLAVLEEE